MTANNEDYIINDMTPELAAKYALPPMTSNIYKVYFDITSKEILAIANEAISKYDTFFEIEYESIEKFLNGSESFSNFRVFLNSKNNFEIIPKIVDQDSIKASVLVDILPTEEPAFLTINNNVFSKTWSVELDEEEKERLKNKTINYKILIFITSSINKNFLFRTVTVDLKDLVKNGSVSIEHLLKVESFPAKLSLSTVQFFKSYRLRNVYESKI